MTSISQNVGFDEPVPSTSSATTSRSHRPSPSPPPIHQQKQRQLQRQQTSTTSNVDRNRHRLSMMLSLHGFSACREALVLLEDHFTSSTKYDSMEDFIVKLNKVITFTDAGKSVIDPDLAYTVLAKLQGSNKTVDSHDPDLVIAEEEQQVLIPVDPPIKVKNVQYEQTNITSLLSSSSSSTTRFCEKQATEFNIHYNFLFKKLSSLPIFQGDFQLVQSATLTGSSQPSRRCICLGLLIKDISKIDGYMLIDSTGRVPVRITPDTTFRNRLAYTDCIVLVEGVYINPDDILFAANIGLPPILLDPIQDKSLACRDEQLVVILKELYLDDEDVCSGLDMLFTGYNSMENPPKIFIMIGDFTREQCPLSQYKVHTKKLIRIIRSCDNLKGCHYIFVPGLRDTSPIQIDLNTSANNTSVPFMPKPPLTKEQIPVNLLQLSNFNNVHLATNPAHIYFGERQISIVSHSYIKELKKRILHDMSDHREELFETIKQIVLSNAHLSAGITKAYHSSMNLWHKPDLLILAETDAFGNRYDYSSSSTSDTTFATLPSFARQSNQFKVYYIKSGEIEDSQVSFDAYQDLEESAADVVQLIEEERQVSELDD